MNMSLEAGRAGFEKKIRLRRRAEYLHVYKHGQSVHAKGLVLFWLPNNAETTRVGMTASRQIGKAHVRNRMKRRLREIFRLNKNLIKPGYDLVINVRQVMNRLDYKRTEDSLITALGKAGLLVEDGIRIH
jgi:ribonuclease P protein component